MTNNYNSVAGVYDVLSRTIFQNALINAQQFLINFISSNTNILIVGGGTGWILKSIADRHLSNINIVYVEKSANMIALAQKRNDDNLTVEFINKAIEDFTTDKTFDVIYTAFLFDNFKPDKIEILFDKLHQLLKPNALWLYADFVNNQHNKLWQRFLLKTMYIFFKLTCNIETQQLINMHDYYAKHYTKTAEAFFYKNFIQSKVYQKK